MHAWSDARLRWFPSMVETCTTPYMHNTLCAYVHILKKPCPSRVHLHRKVASIKGTGPYVRLLAAFCVLWVSLVFRGIFSDESQVEITSILQFSWSTLKTLLESCKSVGVGTCGQILAFVHYGSDKGMCFANYEWLRASVLVLGRWCRMWRPGSGPEGFNDWRVSMQMMGVLGRQFVHKAVQRRHSKLECWKTQLDFKKYPGKSISFFMSAHRWSE
jgi:hypothetical protein